MTSKGLLGLVFLCVLCLLIPSCAEESPTTDDTRVTGTGSAGGNPAALTFSAESESRYPSLEWQQPEVSVATVRLHDRGDDGECASEGTEQTAFDGTIAFDGLDQLVFDEAFPCAIELIPQRDTPFMTVEAIFEESKTVRLDLWFEWGIELRLDSRDRFESSRDVYFTLELDRLLEGFDHEGRLQGSDDVVIPGRDPRGRGEEMLRLEMNFRAASRLYLDPTPGDGRLDYSERTPENVIGVVEILPPVLPSSRTGSMDWPEP